MGYTNAKLILITVSLILVLMIGALFLSRTILAQWFDPQHAQIENRKKLFELTEKLDSLEQQVAQKELYISTFKNIVSGQIDSSNFNYAEPEKAIFSATMDLNRIAPIDSQFRKQFEDQELNLLSFDDGSDSDIGGLFFYTPISGYISRGYNQIDEHFGVDVVAKKSEPIMSVANGTVILSSWTQDSGYVLAIQHTDNLISVYKHNSELLKKVGNFVLGGEVVAIIGNTGELTDGPHLHFELWYNGNPVNPEDFVTF